MRIYDRVSPVSRRLRGWRRLVRKVAHILQGTLIIEQRGSSTEIAR